MSHQHLEGLNQPRPRSSRSRSRSARGDAIVDGLGLEEDESKDEDDLSLEASDLFEPPKPLSAKKPLLAATLKAMEDSKSKLALKDSKSKLQQLHVLTNNATKALEDSKSKLHNSSTSSGAHLEGMNQPTPRSKSRKEGSDGWEDDESFDDEESLETSALFDPPKIMITKKPLLAATLKAMNESKSSKLNNTDSTTSLVPTPTPTATTTTPPTTTVATSQQQQQQEQAQQTNNNNNKSSNTLNYNYTPKQKSNKSSKSRSTETETEQERKKRQQKDQKVCAEYNLKTDDNTTTMQSNDTPLVNNTREESSMFDSPAAAKAAATAMYTATADKMKMKKYSKNKKQGRLYQKKYTIPSTTTRSNKTGASVNGNATTTHTIDRGIQDNDNHQQQDQEQQQQQEQCCYPGALNIDEMIYGIQMAHLSSTDDSDERLVNSSPNCLIALEHLVAHPGNGIGTSTDSTIDYAVEDCVDPAATALLPLSQILHDRFHLQLQCIIDESGLRKGRPVDTQGYIASNDDMIILSYRFSTSIFDWITNFSMTSSEWELEHDEELGHAGMCSCFDGVYTKYCTMKEAKPRVHTAYYNNFIYTIPMIRKYIIEPLLDPTTTPKKVYVVGCSLGAAISQLAYCFILQEMVDTLQNPQYTPHRLISVTAGCPRVGDAKFRQVMMDKMHTLKPLNRAVINRIVYNKDIIPHIPPNVLAFCHLDKMVYLLKEGEQLLINPDMSKIYTTFGELQQIYKTVFQKKRESVHENMTANLKKVQERSQALRLSAASTNAVVENRNNEEEASEACSVVRITDLDDVGDEDGEEGGTATAAAVEEKTTTMAAFEAECEGAMEAIHDHMAYWYLTYLEKIRDEQEALFVVASEQQHNDDTDENGNH
mmetsp:Transcript_27256/g.31273  ORF Transcript_27256/g.31273 Transcript_27256/m.31273 type:complete len:880 (-) Transcript_27256:150-2789(-)